MDAFSRRPPRESETRERCGTRREDEGDETPRRARTGSREARTRRRSAPRREDVTPAVTGGTTATASVDARTRRARAGVVDAGENADVVQGAGRR